jgi:hypothetical protein
MSLRRKANVVPLALFVGNSNPSPEKKPSEKQEKGMVVLAAHELTS